MRYSNSFKDCSHPGVTRLAERLFELLAPEGMMRVFFNSGGSDAAETALKLARRYWELASGMALILGLWTQIAALYMIPDLL